MPNARTRFVYMNLALEGLYHPRIVGASRQRALSTLEEANPSARPGAVSASANALCDKSVGAPDGAPYTATRSFVSLPSYRDELTLRSAR